MEEYTPNTPDVTEEPAPKAKFKLSKKTWYIILVCVAAALLAVSVIVSLKTFVPPKKEDFTTFKNPAAVIPTTPQPENIAPEDLPANPINFEALKAECPNACAWIQIPGIEIIDYPVMISTADMDDNFYLDHDRDGKNARAGAIYIQKINVSKKFDAPNTVVYGHNMLNGTMFGQLKKFRDKAFFDANRKIYVYTPGHILEYEIISAFIYDDRHIINSFNFNDETSRMEFFNSCTNPNSMTKNVLAGATLDQDDKIITLSTCTANDSERYLVVGKLINDFKTK